MSKVYFLKLNELDKIKQILPEFVAPLGVKVHFGEKGNTTFVPAEYIKKVAEMIESPTLLETSVLYRSPRSQASSHEALAREHGFDFAPIDFLDGEYGDDVLEVKVDGKHFRKCYLGEGIEKYKSLLVLSHFKGHGAAVFGGALKNLGMGLAARRGKLAQHASIQHSINQESCTGCGQCINDCPVDALSFDFNNKAEINRDKCISCSKCISVCPVKAAEIPWGTTGIEALQEKIVEYAWAGIKDRECFYINFLINITAECDCQGKTMETICDNIGILASSDPVAIDQAAVDLVKKQTGDIDFQTKNSQTEYAEKLGLGSREYEIINL